MPQNLKCHHIKKIKAGTTLCGLVCGFSTHNILMKVLQGVCLYMPATRALTRSVHIRCSPLFTQCQSELPTDHLSLLDQTFKGNSSDNYTSSMFFLSVCFSTTSKNAEGM